MKKFARLLSLVLVGMMALSMFTGCSMEARSKEQAIMDALNTMPQIFGMKKVENDATIANDLQKVMNVFKTKGEKKTITVDGKEVSTVVAPVADLDALGLGWKVAGLSNVPVDGEATHRYLMIHYPENTAAMNALLPQIALSMMGNVEKVGVRVDEVKGEYYVLIGYEPV